MNSPMTPEEVIEALLKRNAYLEEMVKLRDTWLYEVMKKAARQGVDFGDLTEELRASRTMIEAAEAALAGARETNGQVRTLITKTAAVRAKGAIAGAAANKAHAQKKQAWADENWPLAIKEAGGNKKEARAILRRMMLEWSEESGINAWALRTIQDKF